MLLTPITFTIKMFSLTQQEETKWRQPSVSKTFTMGHKTGLHFPPTVIALLLVSSVAVGVNCFIPNTQKIARLSVPLTPLAVTHVAMTRRAMLHVAFDILRDNPCDSSSLKRMSEIRMHNINGGELLLAYYGEKRHDRVSRFQGAIRQICDANAAVDNLASAHFDSEHFQEGQSRLVHLRQTIVEAILKEEYGKARVDTGRMLHTLQDFYSHSNWVEMNNREPHSGLGKDGVRLVVAGPNTPTCRDCRQNGLVCQILRDHAKYYYECQNNILPTVLTQHVLTSGYYGNEFDERFDKVTGRVIRDPIKKPRGKCSHGGYMDTTSDTHATGGINKDSPYPQLSPHSSLHYEAARLAELATVNILNEIRGEANDDTKFAAYFNLVIT